MTGSADLAALLLPTQRWNEAFPTATVPFTIRNISEVAILTRISHSVRRQLSRFLFRSIPARLYAFVPSKGARSGLLLLPATSPGSLGDEAMVRVALRVAIERGETTIYIMNYGQPPGWESVAAESAPPGVTFHFVSLDAPAQLFVIWRLLRRVRNVWICGADVLDGFYSEAESLRRLTFVQWAAAAGGTVSVLGFSFNATPSPRCVRALRNLGPNVRLCARDPHSHQRLERMLLRSVEPVADLAFLLSPSDGKAVQISKAWIEEERQRGRLLLGLSARCNLGTRSKVLTSDQTIGAFVQIIEATQKRYPHASWLLVAHDSRRRKDEIGDQLLHEKILSGLSAELQAHVHLVGPRNKPDDIKFLCGRLDAMLACKMHVAIACLSQQVPTVAVSYQDKFEGLFAMLDSSEELLAPETGVDLPVAMAEAFEKAIERRNELQRKLREHLPAVLAASRRNFDVT